MDKRRSRSARPFAVEALDGRLLMSGTTTAAVMPAGTVEVASTSGKAAQTHTTLDVHAGTLQSPLTFTASVRSTAKAGSPTGTVNILDHGTVIETLTLSPTTSSDSRAAVSSATATLTQPAGGAAYFFGKHQLTATFVPSGSFKASSVNKTFTVAKPNYMPLANGVKAEVITPGSGAQIQSGQTANVMYTGYLAKTGQIFDDSQNDGGTSFSFKLGSGQVIPGFDSGTVGMQVGETRAIYMPASQAYGSAANGAIPPNSPLIFVVTLKSIS